MLKRNDARIRQGRKLPVDILAAHPGKSAEFALAEVEPQPPGFVMLRIRFADGLMTHFEDYYEASGMMRALEDWAEEFPNAPWTKYLQDPHMRAPRDAES